MTRVKWIVLAVAAVVLAAVYHVTPAVGDVSGETLFYSLTGEVEGTVPQINPCARQATSWMCRVSDQGVSGYAIYRVRLQGNCWVATKVFTAEEEPLPERADGCVGVADQLRVGTRIVDALLPGP